MKHGSVRCAIVLFKLIRASIFTRRKTETCAEHEQKYLTQF
jgi:hypothetical protein